MRDWVYCIQEFSNLFWNECVTDTSAVNTAWSAKNMIIFVYKSYNLHTRTHGHTHTSIVRNNILKFLNVRWAAKNSRMRIFHLIMTCTCFAKESFVLKFVVLSQLTGKRRHYWLLRCCFSVFDCDRHRIFVLPGITV